LCIGALRAVLRIHACRQLRVLARVLARLGGKAARCALKDLKLVLGVADGSEWRYLSVPME